MSITRASDGYSKVTIDFSKLHWQSDCNGYEAGYDDVDVIGFYTFISDNDYEYSTLLTINMDTLQVLDIETIS